MKKILKNKTKKSTLRRDYLEVVAEDIREQVKTIGEGHKMLNEKLDRNLVEIKKEFTRADNESKNLRAEMNSNFKTIFDYLSNIDEELKEIKNEIKTLKESLKNKADLIRLETLELRVEKIERELAHSG